MVIKRLYTVTFYLPFEELSYGLTFLCHFYFYLSFDLSLSFICTFPYSLFLIQQPVIFLLQISGCYRSLFLLFLDFSLGNLRLVPEFLSQSYEHFLSFYLFYLCSLYLYCVPLFPCGVFLLTFILTSLLIAACHSRSLIHGLFLLLFSLIPVLWWTYGGPMADILLSDSRLTSTNNQVTVHQ